ncbi:SGNH/GDSL hydrolase family protein [Streptosporangium sp. NBC_01639]|uniref:SGNH/GDSL hydrolase family protein n=1 Tax=unclassified Streptosporangium TaxID=2632669 RepID=UPI002DDC5DBD|nr:SGNH/GDSL hydrolase family protein [Streptosporangium sp. NBC_01756]WSC89714.1 SGNH/GDSL hydrolase family protein [Streptosporangium sp. NBC_01756]WTD51650.1 SGNH/GDSL hydrolase family protein [Streptosporangium sp. NBC_01639]
MKRLFAALALSLTVAAVPAAVPAAAAAERTSWTGSWSASPQRPSTGFAPNWSQEGFEGHTLRQVVRLTAAGTTLRVRLSNQYGSAPLKIAGATIARTGQGAGLRPGSVRPLTFGGSRSVTIAPGGGLASDVARLRVGPLESVTITLYLPERTGPATFHAQGYATTYRTSGDHLDDLGAAAFTGKTQSWYYLTDVEVSGGGTPRREAVVTLGDSITDGFGSTTDSDNRYPDELAEHLREAGRPRPVLNAGIGGNRLLNDSAWYGEPALARLQRDALSKPGVGTLIVLQGINDIGFADWTDPTAAPNPRISAQQLIAAHREIIRRAHAKGIEAIGATLLPYKDSQYFTEQGEQTRDALNQWIRTSGAYDAVLDFDRRLAAPGDADQLNPIYDSGDHLHPNDRGYQVMAEAVDLP